MAEKMIWRAISAAMALSIGALVLWVVAIGSDDPNPQARPTSPAERDAVRVEKRLAEDPRDRSLQLATIRAWLDAGGERISHIDTSIRPVPAVVLEDFRAGLRAWKAYNTRSGANVGAFAAQMASAMSFGFVEIGSKDPAELEAAIDEAVQAQRIVCERDPNFLTLSNLALYEYFNGEFAAGDRAARAALADSLGPNTKYAKQQIGEMRERAEGFLAKLTRARQMLRETGEEELGAPLRSFANSAINQMEE